MKTLELYIEILKKVRFETLDLSGQDDLRLENHLYNSSCYRAITTITSAALELSSLISVMEQELMISKSKVNE